MKKKLKVNCPKCKLNFEYYNSEFRPFCSERCKMVDLGHWFEGSYTVASNEPLTDGDIEQVLKEQDTQDLDGSIKRH